jgi:hypothetical protein
MSTVLEKSGQVATLRPQPNAAALDAENFGESTADKSLFRGTNKEIPGKRDFLKGDAARLMGMSREEAVPPRATNPDSRRAGFSRNTPRASATETPQRNLRDWYNEHGTFGAVPKEAEIPRWTVLLQPT